MALPTYTQDSLQMLWLAAYLTGFPPVGLHTLGWAHYLTPRLLYEKYVSPVLSSTLEYFIFQDDIAWQSHALDLIKNTIFLQDTDLNRELAVSIHIQQLWMLLLENLTLKSSDNKAAVISRTRLQLMMQYIHTHYSENIALEDIAASAAIGKGTALHLFQENIKITPVNYLIRYRLKQAALLLSGTEKKITVISFETGFNNVDHFCRSFKKIYGITPTDYRKQSDQTTEHGKSSYLHP